VTREVILYTRQDCGLCDQTAEALRDLRREFNFVLREVDVDADPALRQAYNNVVPVVAVADRVIAHAPVDYDALRSSLIEEFRR
jgi:glutaredoxin